LVLKTTSERQAADGSGKEAWRPAVRPNILPERITEKEKEAHKVFVESLGPGSVWNKLA
jgi:DNA polymerase-3 subunit epsilon